MSATVEPDAAAAAGGVKRRDFLKILGAGTAVTASVGCSTKGVGHLIPYLVSPDETVPGVSTYYASTCRECAASCGILVETRDGRITKLEGNPAHPLNRGALCARGQAAPQGLYNPDRYREPMVRKDGKLVPTTWDDALHLLAQKLGEVRSRNQAAGAAFVNLHESGAFPGFLDDWLAAFGMPPHISFDPDLPSATLAANRESYGVSWPGLDFSAAHVVVSFGADFLDGWGASVPQQLDWADARGKLADAPRLIYIGARAVADRSQCRRVDPRQAGLPGGDRQRGAGRLGKSTGVTIAQAATESGVDAAVLERLASTLAQTKPSLVLAGGSGVHTLDLARAVNAINEAAGNVGQTVKPAEAITAFEHAATYADIRDLADRMKKGAVPLLMVRGANPAFSTPPALGFAAAMEKVPFKVSFSSYPDETAELCDLVLPDHHALESWGEASPVVGTMSLQQPGMDPVFASRQTADVLVSVAKGDPALAAKYPWPDYRTWLISRFPGAATGFTNALTTGVVTSGAAADGAPKGEGKGEGKGAGAKAQPAKPGAFKAVAPVPGAAIEQSKGDFYLVIYPSPALGDGRGANKPWLQELPDPVTKIVWQTVIEIHPETARKLGVEAGDHLRVETDTGSLEAPAFVYLGIRPDTVAVSLGRGHTAYGRYARNQGLSPLGLIPASEDQAGALALTCTKARVSKGADHTLLVSTEGSARQHGRGIARALTASELAAAPSPETNPVAGVAAPAGGGTAESATEEMPGDASHAFLPGLRSPVANDAQGDYGDTDIQVARHVRRRSLERHGEAPLGDDGRSRAVHGLLGVCDGVLRREQHPDGGCAVAGRAGDARSHGIRRQHSPWPRDGVDPPRALLRGREPRRRAIRSGFRDAVHPDAVPAVRQRAV